LIYEGGLFLVRQSRKGAQHVKTLASIPTICFTLILSFHSFAAPGLMNYQGRLTDKTAKPITTSVDVTFTFYDAETGGSQLGSGFSDTDTVTPSAAGVYSTMIGDDPGNLVPASVFTGDSVWLNVNVGGEDLAPRKRITSVGFAIQSGGASEVKKVIRDFVVESGQSVSAGDVVGFVSGEIRKYGKTNLGSESVFNAAVTRYIAAAALSDTRFVVAYRDAWNLNFGTAVIGTISGLDISWGTPSVFRESPVNQIAVAALSETIFVVAYNKDASPYSGTAIVGNSSDSVISWGIPMVFNSASTNHISICALPNYRFVLAYSNNGQSNRGEIHVGIVSRMQISWYNAGVFTSDSISGTAVAGLTPDKYVVAYLKGSIIYNANAIIGFVSETGASFGNEQFLSSPIQNSWISVTSLSDNRFVVAYPKLGCCGAVVVGCSTGDLYPGREYCLNPSSSICIDQALFLDNRIIFVFNDSNNSYHGMGIVGTVSGDRVLLDPEFVFKAAECYDLTIVTLSDCRFVMVYSDSEKANHGMAIAGKTSGFLLGTAIGGGSGGQSVPVIVDGFSDGHTGLEAGRIYYAGQDGSLVMDKSAPPVGRAVSDTELLLDVQRP